MRTISLSNGGEAIVDDGDYDYLSQWKWKRHVGGYACRTSWKNGGWTCVLMHRVIAKPTDGLETDHWNRNKLDNQRHNLRNVTHALNERNKPMNPRNTSGYRGVSWDKVRGKWMAKTKHEGKIINLGRFDAIEDAARAYEEFVACVVPQQCYPILAAIAEEILR